MELQNWGNRVDRMVYTTLMNGGEWHRTSEVVQYRIGWSRIAQDKIE